MPSSALACSYVWLALLFLILHHCFYHSLLCHDIRLIYSLLLPAWLLYVIELDSCLVRFHLALGLGAQKQNQCYWLCLHQENFQCSAGL